jgi:hypothetical protein
MPNRIFEPRKRAIVEESRRQRGFRSGAVRNL